MLCPLSTHEKSLLFKYRLNAEEFQIPDVWLPWDLPRLQVTWGSS